MIAKKLGSVCFRIGSIFSLICRPVVGHWHIAALAESWTAASRLVSVHSASRNLSRFQEQLSSLMFIVYLVQCTNRFIDSKHLAFCQSVHDRCRTWAQWLWTLCKGAFILERSDKIDPCLQICLFWDGVGAISQTFCNGQNTSKMSLLFFFPIFQIGVSLCWTEEVGLKPQRHWRYWVAWVIQILALCLVAESLGGSLGLCLGRSAGVGWIDQLSYVFFPW